MSEKSASGKVYDVTHPASALRVFAEKKQEEFKNFAKIIQEAKSSTEDPKSKKQQ